MHQQPVVIIGTAADTAIGTAADTVVGAAIGSEPYNMAHVILLSRYDVQVLYVTWVGHTVCPTQKRGSRRLLGGA